ncbi:MAG: ribonuclease R [Lachnospiraceae bacterium]|uniref:Ribonuclease R n=1 Tax=Candidatus Weimeria bifida TaxID=2599074 RepID=A0A6N7IWE0_9FIRM|nr:ribonuclease R [Candidatus Weimeria bifida]RRF96013.1 MAG: ribonuclease R [Lachnospiraceae bacterium]
MNNKERWTNQKRALLAVLQDASYSPMTEEELGALLMAADDRELKNALSSLVAEKKIMKSSDGTYYAVKKEDQELFTEASQTESDKNAGNPETDEALEAEERQKSVEKQIEDQKEAAEERREEDKYLVGTFSSNTKGFGFVTVEGFDEDFFIPERYTQMAFHKDTVKIEPIGRPKGDGTRQEAKVVDIVEHAYTDVVGTFERSGNFGFVVPDDRHLTSDIFVPAQKLNGAPDNAKVVCHLTYYGSANRKPEGEIKEIIGIKGAPGVDILSIVKENDIPTDFPDEVLAEAKKVSGRGRVRKSDMKGRMDLRNVPMVTIDGEDSKDLDDAVSLRMDGRDYILGVHIADVSNYVKEGSQLDKEAYKRCTSVYLPDRVIPMLPVELSNGICSLNEGEDRLAMSCIMRIDDTGAVKDHQIAESIIRSNHRMTYTSVNKILEQNDPDEIEKYRDVVPMFKQMEELAFILHGRRTYRGSIDFDFPETVVELDDDGNPKDVHPYYRGVAQKMIEDFMLAANETVAKHAYDHKFPFLYRTHGFPDPEKLETLKSFVGGFGYTLEGNVNQIHPKELQKLLDRVEGAPEEGLIQTLTLRSMQQAKYTTECTGHFGLAAGYYCHFTSPIRRYPDLFIHRVLKLDIHHKLTKKKIRELNEALPDIADRTSTLERRADSAERDSIKLKKVEYMVPHIGEEFTGRISGVTSWGLYVALQNSIEGMIPVRTMNDDYYEFSEETYELIGKSFNRHYTLGMMLRVRLVDAEPTTRLIDFELVDDFMGGGTRHKKKPYGLEKQDHSGRFSKKAKKQLKKFSGERFKDGKGKNWKKNHRH